MYFESDPIPFLYQPCKLQTDLLRSEDKTNPKSLVSQPVLRPLRVAGVPSSKFETSGNNCNNTSLGRWVLGDLGGWQGAFLTRIQLLFLSTCFTPSENPLHLLHGLLANISEILQPATCHNPSTATTNQHQ